MERLRKCQGRARHGCPKADTPLKKPSNSQRGKYKKLLLKNVTCYSPLPEEPLLDETGAPSATRSIKTWPDRRPIQCKTLVLFSRDPVLTENLEERNTIVADNETEGLVQLSKPANQMIPALKDHETRPVERTASSDTENDTAFTLSHGEEDCLSNSSLTSSSLPSPEIFRREEGCHVLEAVNLSTEFLDADFHVKNSTLLDVSRAGDIHMQPAPNVSTIIENPDKRNTPKLTRPILFKKKVHFKSPVIDIAFKKTNCTDAKLTSQCFSETDKAYSPASQMSVGPEMLKGDQQVEQAKFFHFATGNDRDAFFQRIRQRYAKIRNGSIFNF